MPTGYTRAVQDGTVTKFPEFAMQCARAFGALVLMRDDPSDAEVPDKFEPSDYHITRLPDAEAKLSRLLAMNEDQINVAAHDAHQESLASWNKREAQRKEHRERYEAMIAKVEDWVPPTPDHIDMKKFMVDQLNESIRFDCTPGGSAPVKPKSSDWYSKAVDSARDEVDRHKEEHTKEVERAANSTAWVQALRKSLATGN